ncbi:uncharacterized protein EV420DRAFT_1544332 [Desarmillaria tabescens]|uniref:Uncharacterized protein n=1 Tax=Armillaria tabescens TaxID=1929756 RepID=A0AA39N5J2_ARMTA|nr:uncharacterized protein EV420DRAFT_1544332 [Desarmillaria tabescens]KAK0458238.1 hypothetical protein EV420DRAFT_1544332 [Desarmillaria tabescens]
MSLTLFRLTASRISHLRRQFSSSMATASTVTDSSSKPSGPIESSIREKLTNLLQPTSLYITNDSWQVGFLLVSICRLIKIFLYLSDSFPLA